MAQDLRQIALEDVDLLRAMGDRYPRGSVAWSTLYRASLRMKREYVDTVFHKQQLIVRAIDRGHRRFTELIRVTSIERNELEELLAALVAAEMLREELETPVSSDGRGRPARIFVRNENK